MSDYETTKSRIRAYQELKHLQEADDTDDDPAIPAQEIPMTDEEYTPVSDGAIPQNAEGITSGTYDPINPQGVADLSFKQGNLNSLQGYVSAFEQKAQLVLNTLEPLVEKALIELLGTSSMYSRESGNVAISFDSNTFSITGTLQYQASMWIGIDIPREDIVADSEYVLNTLKIVQNVQITKCEIDTTAGTLTVQFQV
jgi:hypothetical protein